MKKIRKLLSFILVVTCMMGLNVQAVFAQSANESTTSEIENRIKEELMAYISEEEIALSIENINCSIDYNCFESIDELNVVVTEKIEEIKKELGSANVTLEEKQVKTRSIVNNGSYYTAKVESIVPAIGWGYICQDFTASVSGGKINSITLQGGSYDTGITLGSWEENRTWKEISTNKKYCQIHMKGTVNYIWEGLNLSMNATFLATGKANGSKIESADYEEWPD